ncbi:OmpP1/FadL family transporter [Herbaspirillum sp. NPDC087042]|uniref:OmpP1/FadL family transporter n=1 Tax=Herbaspirillum sp. NPDC087042 TaxID=3364004 RepID=UPI0038251A57
MLRNSCVVRIGLVAAAVLESHLAFASGYQFATQSALDQGTSGAGAAEAATASTLYSNPAGLSNVDGTSATINFTRVAPQSGFSFDTARTGNPATPTNVPSASNGGDFAKSVLIPTGYISRRLDERYTIGLGVFVPYGAKAAFDNDFAGRYYTRATDMKSVNINPSIAIKLNDSNSIGFGISAQYMDASFDKNFNMQSMAVGACLSSLGAACSGATLAAVSSAYGPISDATVHVTGSDWGMGYNLGYMYQPDRDTRIGLAYRSRITQKLTGTAAFSVPNLPTAGALASLSAGMQAALVSAGATVAVTTPATLSLHGYKHFKGPWAIMGDITWTSHSDLQTLSIKSPTSTDPNRNITYSTKWGNAYKFSVGASYDVSDRFTVRGGYMYDKSPVPGADYALTTMPDADRQWFSIGATYKLSENNSVDVAYSYIKLKPASINRTDDDYIASNGTPGVLVGQYSSRAQVFGIQYNHKF